MEILGDFQTSVRKALSEIDPRWESRDGLIICGSHSPTLSDDAVEPILEKIKEAREQGRAVLGICWGYQLCAIEYARNVLGIQDATSEEWGNGTFVVKKRSEPLVGLREGQSYWSYYEVEPEIEAQWKKPANWVTVPHHPEYQSSYWNPHPLLVSFLGLCKK